MGGTPTTRQVPTKRREAMRRGEKRGEERRGEERGEGSGERREERGERRDRQTDRETDRQTEKSGRGAHSTTAYNKRSRNHRKKQRNLFPDPEVQKGRKAKLRLSCF